MPDRDLGQELLLELVDRQGADPGRVVRLAVVAGAGDDVHVERLAQAAERRRLATGQDRGEVEDRLHAGPAGPAELDERVVVAVEDLVRDRPERLAAQEADALEGDRRLEIDAHLGHQAGDPGRRLAGSRPRCR